MTLLFSSAEAENKALIARINAVIGRTFFKEGKYTFYKEELPFYQKTFLVKATCFTTMPNVTRTFLCDDNNTLAIDGTQDAIEDANQKFSLNLNKNNIVAYVSFFFNSLRTADGKFKLITSVEGVPFVSVIDEELVQNLSNMIYPPKIKEGKNSYTMDAFVLYAQTLYKAVIAVSSAGEIEINDEEPVYEDLPVQRIKLR